MTDLLEQAVAAARGLAPDRQDDIARIVLRIAEEARRPAALTAEDEASFAISRSQSARGEFATDDVVRAVWAKHGL
ncbi:hypothetical protein AFCDBAGC_2535 [Methylobacterium cerastii]|uniref:Uncharacterized protein n=1 Tax=Methylobacterium cerastii TaxID=932741 RepID=A0ABQ4QHH3_9HYPH|nr:MULTISPECIES: hypothetical protein [Methylobacterium]TXM88599.1 hypothetical protein FV219_24315 [Methylobacterium sp. WL122]TXN81757.1 hypothetical protein FV234_12595 [Methylobacterium sp. WL8]GJD44668.1 hypothetical protein AFCDBAGC_2535 [Methylobacterium cerastii]